LTPVEQDRPLQCLLSCLGFGPCRICVLTCISVKEIEETVSFSPASEKMKLRGSETNAIVGMLQKAPLWSGLNEKELKVIARSFKELKYESGDIIVRKGEAGVGFYLMAEGTVEVRSDGKVLSRLGPGQFFGEMALLDGQPRSADVVALEPSKCLALTSWSFKSIVSNHPKMAVKLLQESARRSRTNTQNLSE